MPEEDDRAAVLAAMYQDEEPAMASSGETLVPHGRTRKIRVGVIDYIVPSVEYMTMLEQQVAHHTRLIEHSQRIIDRLVAALSRTRHSQKSFEKEITDLRRELSKKISQRDFSS